MPRHLTLGLAVLVACASPAAVPAGAPRDPTPVPAAVPPPFRGVRCLDLPGAPRRNLQLDPRGDLLYERWTHGGADLVRLDLATGAEEPVLTNILGGHRLDDRLVALRDEGRSRRLTIAGPGLPEAPWTPAEHDLTSYALAPRAVLYTTGEGQLFRLSLDAEAPSRLAEGILAVHAADGDAAIVSVATEQGPELALLAPPAPLRLLAAVPGPLTLHSGQLLLGTDEGLAALPLDGGAPSVRPGLELLRGGPFLRRPGALLDPDTLAPRIRFSGAALVEALPVPGGIWALALHDTDRDGHARPLTDEADLCRLELDAAGSLTLPTRTLPRRLAGALPSLRQLLTGDLAGGDLDFVRGALLFRAAGSGPRAREALAARVHDLHRAAVLIVGDHTLELLVHWRGNDRHASVSWDSSNRRPLVRVGGHGLAVDAAPHLAAHELRVAATPEGRHQVTCEGHLELGPRPPWPLELRCAARPRGGGPLLEAARTLAAPTAGAVGFSLELGELDAPPAASELRLRHAGRELALTDPADLADLDDYLRLLDTATALGLRPSDPRDELAHLRARDARHPPPTLERTPDFDVVDLGEQRRRARAVWDLFATHHARHHGQQLRVLRLSGQGGAIRRGELE